MFLAWDEDGTFAGLGTTAEEARESAIESITEYDPRLGEEDIAAVLTVTRCGNRCDDCPAADLGCPEKR